MSSVRRLSAAKPRVQAAARRSRGASLAAHSAAENRHTGLKGSAPVFAALGDETRLRLVTRLCTDGPMSIARLSAGADVTRQAITKHLEVLAHAGLLKDFRQGRERLFEV